MAIVALVISLCVNFSMKIEDPNSTSARLIIEIASTTIAALLSVIYGIIKDQTPSDIIDEDRRLIGDFSAELGREQSEFKELIEKANPKERGDDNYWDVGNYWVRSELSEPILQAAKNWTIGFWNKMA